MGGTDPQGFAQQLSVHAVADGVFEASAVDGSHQRAFGGTLIAHALAAAAVGVAPERAVHFLRSNRL